MEKLRIKFAKQRCKFRMQVVEQPEWMRAEKHSDGFMIGDTEEFKIWTGLNPFVGVDGILVRGSRRLCDLNVAERDFHTTAACEKFVRDMAKAFMSIGGVCTRVPMASLPRAGYVSAG